MPKPVMRPMLSYYGGDQRIATRLLDLVDTIPHRIWCEVFCGGATLTFGKPKPTANGDNYTEVINDKNDWIYTYYKVARDRPDELNWRIQHTPHSQAVHRETIRILKQGSDNELDIAWAVYVQCNQTFSSQMFKGWAFSMSNNNQAHVWQNKLSAYPLQLERLKHVYIDSLDAIKFIERWDRQGTLFYCDPPYVDTDQGHYKGYTQEDLDNLINALDNCKGSFILNCYDNPSIPSHWNRIEIESVMSAAKVKLGEKQANNRRVQVVTWMDRSGMEAMPLLKLLDKHL